MSPNQYTPKNYTQECKACGKRRKLFKTDREGLGVDPEASEGYWEVTPGKYLTKSCVTHEWKEYFNKESRRR